MSLPFALNPALETLPVYQPGRPIEEVAREIGLPARGIIKLASNENPFGPSPAALAALKSAVKKLGLYPDGNAFYLKQKLAAHLSGAPLDTVPVQPADSLAPRSGERVRERGSSHPKGAVSRYARLRVTPNHLVLGNGSNDILEFLAHALLRPGTDAIMSEYCFAIYPLVTRLLGANPIIVPAKQYGHDLPAIVKAITPATKAIFLANPNNPTGTLVPSSEVLAFLDQVPSNVVIIMDEAYIDFLEHPLDLIPQILRGKKPNLILLRTFSKIYGLAGLRLGYGIAHPEFIAALEKIRQPFNVNTLAQAAGLAALDDTAHVQKTRQNNFAGLKFFGEKLREMGVEYIPSHANFILAKVGDGKRVFEALQAKGIIVRPMQGYGLPEWLRITIGLPRENHRCARALKAILRKTA